MGEFTVRDLAQLTGINQHTVSTFVTRSLDIIEPTGRQETTQPGGQFIKYRIRPEKVESARASIDEQFSRLAAIRSGASVDVPLGLRAVEDLLSRRFQRAPNDEKAQLFELAQIRIETARAEVAALLMQVPGGPPESQRLTDRLAAVEHMNDLCAKQLDLGSSGNAEKTRNLLQLVADSQALAEGLYKSGECDPAVALLNAAIGAAVNAAMHGLETVPDAELTAP